MRGDTAKVFDLVDDAFDGIAFLKRRESWAMAWTLFEGITAMMPRASGCGREGNPRLMWIGQLLRRSRLNELAQLFNVPKGEMGLVARPIQTHFADVLDRQVPFVGFRFDLRSGLAFACLLG